MRCWRRLSLGADVFQVYGAGSEGATDYLLLVDKEVGTVLRVAARLDDRAFRVAEIAGISYDEEFAPGTFQLELPGVEFKRRELPDYERRERP